MRNSACSSFRLLADWLCILGVMALLPALFPPSHHMSELTCLPEQRVKIVFKRAGITEADSRCFV